MRNNPKHGNKLEYGEIFRKYAKIEKTRRFFSVKRQKLYKILCSNHIIQALIRDIWLNLSALLIRH